MEKMKAVSVAAQQNLDEVSFSPFPTVDYREWAHKSKPINGNKSCREVTDDLRKKRASDAFVNTTPVTSPVNQGDLSVFNTLEHWGQDV